MRLLLINLLILLFFTSCIESVKDTKGNNSILKTSRQDSLKLFIEIENKIISLKTCPTQKELKHYKELYYFLKLKFEENSNFDKIMIQTQYCVNN